MLPAARDRTVEFAAGQCVTTANNVIAIGSAAQNVNNSCFIGQIYTNVQPQVGNDPDRSR